VASASTLQDQPIEEKRGDFTLSTRRDRLDFEATLRLLTATHWGDCISRELLERSIANSICFGIYHGPRQVGFGRVVTDLATYGYLTDMVIDAEYRGQGLGNWMVEKIVDHPDLQGFRRLALLTLDAQELYGRHGFGTDLGTHTYMERRGAAMDAVVKQEGSP
jgi:ribosomal protein S18 acetylase RimI-like enzyme